MPAHANLSGATRIRPAWKPIGTAMASKLSNYAPGKTGVLRLKNGADLEGVSVLKQFTWVICAKWLSLSAAALAANHIDARFGPEGVRMGGRKWGHPLRRSYPPEYASHEHRVINGHGIELEHTDAQKTADQAADGRAEKGRRRTAGQS